MQDIAIGLRMDFMQDIAIGLRMDLLPLLTFLIGKKITAKKRLWCPEPESNRHDLFRVDGF